MSAEELLVRRAQGGDEVAFRRLVREYRWLIHSAPVRRFAPGLDHDDIRQEALVGFGKAVRDYKPGEGGGFRPFAILCVGRQLDTIVKKATRRKHAPVNESLSMDEAIHSHRNGSALRLGDTLPDPKADPQRQLEEREALRTLATAIWIDLSDLERAALRCLLNGIAYEQVAEEEGVSVKTIDNALQRCRRKLAPALEAAA